MHASLVTSEYLNTATTVAQPNVRWWRRNQ